MMPLSEYNLFNETHVNLDAASSKYFNQADTSQ